MDEEGRINLTDSSKSSRKSAFLMRVPDDILSLLDNCALNQGASSPKLSIKCDGSTGVIKIQNDGNDETFSFNISNKITARDSTYCVREDKTSGLEVLALMQQRINIKPGTSSFERARSKMTDQRKKNPCKAIEVVNSSTELGSKKVNVKRPRATTTTPDLKKLNATIKKKYTHYQGFDIVSQPLRKRIVHTLALKPYSKPEILAKLMQEGISELDKNRLTITLYAVAFVKKELYYLDKWNEIEDDWRFYSPEDAATVRRRKQEQCQPPNSNLTSKTQPNNGHLKKRSLVDEIIAGSSYPVQKKQKKTDIEERKNDAPSILQYMPKSSTKDNLHVASGVKNYIDRDAPLLSSIQRPSSLPKGFLGPASEVKSLQAQVPLTSSTKKKRKKKKNKKDTKKSAGEKNEDRKKKNKKSKKRKRKNRKKKEKLLKANTSSIDSTKTVDSKVTITDTVHHKVFSHVQFGSQNSIHELNNVTDKKKEKHSISLKRAFKENSELSSRQLKKMKCDMVISPAPVRSQSFDLSDSGSVNQKPHNESANKMEKTSYKAQCSIRNVKTAHRLSHELMVISPAPVRSQSFVLSDSGSVNKNHQNDSANKIEETSYKAQCSIGNVKTAHSLSHAEKTSDRHNKKNSVIFNFGLNNLVAKYSKSTGKEVNSEKKLPSENFKITDFPTQESTYSKERKEKQETQISSNEVETCHSVDFKSLQQSSPTEDILDALFFGDDPGHATAVDDNILDEFFFGDDQVKENTKLTSTVEDNSLHTDIVIKKITGPLKVSSSTVEEHIAKSTDTVSGQRSETSSVLSSESSSQMRKITSPGLPTSTVEEKTVKSTDTMSVQLNKTSSVFTPEDFCKTKKPTSPGVSSTVEEHITKCAVNGQMSKTSSFFLPEDFADGNKITSPSAIPSSTVDDTTLDTNTVCLSNYSSTLSFNGDSILVQEANVSIPKEKQNITSPSVLESVELFNKQREFVPVESLSNYESQVSRALESLSSQSISKILCGYPWENIVLSDTYGFSKKFCKITSFQQRTKYKEYFNSKYSGYLKLHKRITLAEARLTKLEDHFKTVKEGTPEYTDAMKELLRVYKMYFHDTQYNKFCQSRAYWHEELSYVRNLIREFDNEQFRNVLA